MFMDKSSREQYEESCIIRSIELKSWLSDFELKYMLSHCQPGRNQRSVHAFRALTEHHSTAQSFASRPGLLLPKQESWR